MRGLIAPIDRGPPRRDGRAGGLVEIAGAPLVVHALRRLASAGIAEAGIVVDHGAREEVAAVVDGARPAPVAVRWLERSPAGGAAELRRLVARFAAGAPLVVHATDGVLLEDVAGLVATFAAGDLDALVVRPLSGANGRRQARPPATGPPPPVLQVLGPRAAGRYDAVVEAVCGGPLGAGTEEAAAGPLAAGTEAVVGPVAAGTAAVTGLGRVATRWVDAVLVDETAAVQLEANRRALQQLEGDADAPASVAVQGPVAIDPRATVEASTLRGPVVVGAGAIVREAYLGPYTSVGAGATVAGVEIENSIVMSGAVVRHLGVRIEGSVIGRRCTVDRAFELPRALRVHLGDRASLVLS